MTNVVKEYKTNSKMNLQAIIKPNSSHYVLQWSDGGQIPDSLSGVFTSLVFLDKAVETYVQTTIPKPKLNEAEKAKAKYERQQAKKLEEI